MHFGLTRTPFRESCSSLTRGGWAAALLAVLLLGCSGGSTGSPQGTGGVTGTGGDSGGQIGNGGSQGSGGQQASGGQAGTTPSSGGQSSAGSQLGSGGLPASGGQTSSGGQPASGGQPRTGGQPGTGGLASSGGASAGAGGSATLAGGTSGTGGQGGNAGAGGSTSASSGGASARGGTTGSSGGRISSGGTNSTGGIANGGTTSANGGTTSASGGSTGGKPDPGSLPSITVHLAGDSTMSNYAATTTQEGWGQEFGQFFVSKVTIDNQAQGGANVQSFYSGKWKTLIGNVQAGDYVMAAFGINDSGTAHGPVTPADFQVELSTMADEVAAKKATFIPTTSSPLQVWVGGKETNDRLQPYCDATIAVGKAKGLLVDDLNARGIEYYNSIGQSAAAALTFNGDKAHFDKAGATAMAQLAAQELTRIGSPLAAYLK